jgi:hypothetical protein
LEFKQEIRHVRNVLNGAMCYSVMVNFIYICHVFLKEIHEFIADLNPALFLKHQIQIKNNSQMMFALFSILKSRITDDSDNSQLIKINLEKNIFYSIFTN